MRWKLMMAGTALAMAQAATAGPMDYSRPESWLCRPDATGPCDTDLSLTDISAGGALVVPPPPAMPARFDCFYVYPTVSRQPTGNSDGMATDEERYVVQQQFARFGEICRRFAPLYRQTTLATIPGTVKGDRELAYTDVKAAWERYLAADNAGRGVVLIGHSQGARHLARLVSEEIADKPVAARVVAAHVIGYPVPVAEPGSTAVAPPGLPLCTRANDTGCTVAYVTYAGSRPPVAGNRFAGRPGPGLMVACTDPAAILDTPYLAPIFPARPRPGLTPAIGSLAPVPVETASFRLSGMVRGACTRGADGTSYLAASSDAPRLQAAFERLDTAMPGWGLHMVDMNIALGNLIGLARRQGEAWLAKQSRPR